MKILFVIPSITNYFTFLEHLSKELEEKGHRVYLATSTQHISEIDCYDRPVTGELIELEFPRGFEWTRHIKAAKLLRKAVSEVQPDIINVHFSAAMFTTAIAKKDGWPHTSAMIHGLAFPILRGWRKLAIGAAERWAARRMDSVILLNQADKNALRKSVDQEKIYVLNSFGLGCDLDHFDRTLVSDERSTLFHRRLGVKKGDFVFIFVGRQVHFKGFDKVVKAFLELYGSHKNLKLLLVGAKDHIHTTDLSTSEEDSMNKCPGIINVGWKENVNDYLLVADVNVFPSEREGMPVNLMESLAMGIPVITTDSRGCNEVVKHNMNGLILRKNTVEVLSETMLKLYESSEILEKLSNGARNGRSEFDRKRFISEMIMYFENIQKNS